MSVDGAEFASGEPAMPKLTDSEIDYIRAENIGGKRDPVIFALLDTIADLQKQVVEAEEAGVLKGQHIIRDLVRTQIPYFEDNKITMSIARYVTEKVAEAIERDRAASRELGPCGKHPKMFQTEAKLVRVNEELTQQMVEDGWSYPGGQGESICTICAEQNEIRQAAVRQVLEPLIEEFENLTILGSDEKKAGYETAMRTAVTHLKVALETGGPPPGAGK
jgi:hypothetical protein